MPSRPPARSRRPSPTKPSAPPRYRQQPGIAAHAADGHLFLSGSSLNAIHELNATGAAVWKLLEVSRTEAEIVEVFAAAYPERSRSGLARDVKAVLGALVAAGYVATAGGGRT